MGLELPHVDENAVFGREVVREARRYGLFLDLDVLAGALAGIAVLAWLARRGPRLARNLGLERVNSGIVVGLVCLTAVWAVDLPFALAGEWWQRRHGISRESYAASLGAAWATLVLTALIGFVAFAIVLGLAKRVGRSWWLAAAPLLVGFLLALQLGLPYLLSLGTDPLPAGRLATQIVQLEHREGSGSPEVRIETVSDKTTAANAYSVGVGPTEHVVFWDTLLDGFEPDQVRFVAAHELAHLARDHVLKGIAWFALLLVPVLLAIVWVTERRGGLSPAVVPLGLLVLAVAQFALQPLRAAISRRYEAEADWVALGATRDPGAARGLFAGFVTDSLQDPSPPGWLHALLDDHPSLLDRVELARAWQLRAK